MKPDRAKGPRFTTAAEAAAAVPSGACVVLGGMVSMAVPEAVLRALGERFVAEAAPRELTLLLPNRQGWKPDPQTGLDHLAHEGMVKRVITSTFSHRDSPRFAGMATAGKFEAYSFPMGCLFQLLREQASGSPGFVTEVGLHTYADPGAVDAGKVEVNEATPPSTYARRMEIDGKPYLFYKTFPIDVAIIRGTAADEDGNISMSGEPVDVGIKYQAMAARNSGGLVIAVVRQKVASGTLNPRLVAVPGAWVDYVVVDPEAIQTQLGGHDPSLSGEVRTVRKRLEPLPLDVRKVVARRAAMELKPGDIINLGVGMASGIPSVVEEMQLEGPYHFSTEHGGFGGTPAMGSPGSTGAFGAHYNADCILDSTEVFDFYHGGGLDVAALGFAEVDARGSVNVGHFEGNLRGPGGFVDITHRARKILFCGELTAGKSHLEVVTGAEGGIRVVSDGRFRKFKERVQQVNFHGPTALAKGQEVLYITERAVFRLVDGGLELIELANGVELEQVRSAVGFTFEVSKALRRMDRALFR
ncbi:CoA-transferase [Caenimonas aquaedulcis]|uniref:Acetate CoA-transferase YdiF n=1 Tax=Caenimonas aquaedulcis TaxID=2793270 RepID=A0A931H8R3_9BURK|nr:CoA-transferase [Caenimonas aquaedulcis]MBG9390472.1 acyl CoA:acetate/3-ketoacid CoA transferase [Caenimonas aquaedulcis]